MPLLPPFSFAGLSPPAVVIDELRSAVVAAGMNEVNLNDFLDFYQNSLRAIEMNASRTLFRFHFGDLAPI